MEFKTILFFMLIIKANYINSMHLINFLKQAYYENQFFNSVLANNIEKAINLLDYIDINKPIKNLTPIELACKCENLELIKAIISKESLDINQVYFDEKNNILGTILHLTLDKIEILKILANHPKIKINARDGNSLTPLFKASRENNIDAMEILLSHEKIDLNCKNSAQYTILHDIVYKRDFRNLHVPSYLYVSSLENIYDKKNIELEILKLLINHKNIDLNIKNSSDETPIEYAINSKYADFVKIFLKLGKIKNMYIIEKLQKKIKKNNAQDWYDFLYKLNIRSLKDNYGNNLMHYAFENNKPHIVKVLSQVDLNLFHIKNNFQKTPIEIYENNIYEYIKNNDYKNLKKSLLKIGIYYFLDKNNDTILHHSLRSNNLDIIKLVFYICPSLIFYINKQGDTPINLAAQNPELLKFFISGAYALNNIQ